LSVADYSTTMETRGATVSDVVFIGRRFRVVERSTTPGLL